MGLFETITLTHSIEIAAPPQRVFAFFRGMTGEEQYRAWHPEAHLAFRWEEGDPWEAGSVVYAEELLHGKLHRLHYRVTRITPDREIVYSPFSRFMRFYFPENRFTFEPSERGCIFTAGGDIRVGWLVRTFAKGKLEQGLAIARRHMEEEGENLKKDCGGEKRSKS